MWGNSGRTQQQQKCFWTQAKDQAWDNALTSATGVLSTFSTEDEGCFLQLASHCCLQVLLWLGEVQRWVLASWLACCTCVSFVLPLPQKEWLVLREAFSEIVHTETSYLGHTHTHSHINLLGGIFSFIFLTRGYLSEIANHRHIYRNAPRISQSPFITLSPLWPLNWSPSSTQGFHALSTSLSSKPVLKRCLIVPLTLVCVAFAVLPLQTSTLIVELRVLSPL